MRNTLLVLASATLLFSVGCNQQPSGDSKNPPPPKAASAAPATPMSSAPATAAPSAMPASPVAMSSAAPVGTTSGAPVAQGQGAKKLQDDSGLSFTAPEGAKEDVKPDGEVQYSVGKDLFIAMEAVDSVDKAMTIGVARMKAIDKGAKEIETTDLDNGGVKGKGTRGTVKIDGEENQWMVLAFDGGKKTLRVVLIGKNLKDNAQAKALVESIKK